MRRALICGGAGFISQHLTRRLKADGHFVRIIARREPKDSPHDEFYPPDLRWLQPNDWVFKDIDDVYQCAAVGGGLGFVHDRDNAAKVLRDNVRININVLEASIHHKVDRVFFASSGGVYPALGGALSEIDAMPADPNGEYAWEKLFSERLYAAYRDNHGLKVRIGRLFNTYGPLCTWEGGKERAVAALCRKVAEAKPDGDVEIWGSGSQTRSFIYVEDCVDGIVALMNSDHSEPLNIGSDEYISIDGLVRELARVSKKTFRTVHIKGHIGAKHRTPDTTMARQILGWEAKTPFTEGLRKTYDWIAGELDKKQAKV